MSRSTEPAERVETVDLRDRVPLPRRAMDAEERAGSAITWMLAYVIIATLFLTGTALLWLAVHLAMALR